jgi:beta-glucosidase
MIPRYLDSYQSVQTRVEALLAEMTLSEKVAQLQSVWVNALINADRQFVPERAAARLQNGIGQITRVGGASILPPVQSAELANAIQSYLKYHTRLGIPAIVHEESCAGYLARHATTFPQPIGLAATWAPELIEQMTAWIRAQMRAVGAHHALAPVLDVARDPRWGRVEETFGEDSFLISQMGIAYVRGLQGDDLSQGVAATLKHFIAYSASEGGLNWAPAHLGQRELREVYATPFKAAIREARAATVMNAYNELDGVPLGSSREILHDFLRSELGFDGVVVSDYFTLKTLVDYHAVAADKTEAARLGLEAGIDIELPEGDCYGQPLLQGLAEGKIEPQLVEESVRRILTLKFQLGLFENPFVTTDRIPELYSDTRGVALSRQIAEKSLVLLKNEGDQLPLDPALEAIAVIGPHADDVRLLQGDYHFPSHYEGMFDPNVSLDAPTPGENALSYEWSALMPPSISVLAGIRAVVSPQTRVLYAKGCEVTGTDRSGFAAAVEAAKQAQVAIVVVGDKSGLSKPTGATSGEAIDSATLELPGVQSELIKAIHATGTPVVLVLITGRPYAITWSAEHVPAILAAWLPAEQGGAAIADALFGKVNPGGKLPITFPRHVGQVPRFYAHKPSGGRSNWWRDYVDLSVEPLYAFGHGLSYTRFAYSDLSIDTSHLQAEQCVTIAFTLSNIGERAGDEVVQLYVSDPIASVTRPVKQLKGFKRISLQPNERKRVTFRLDIRHLAFYDRAMRYVVEAGKVIVGIGASAQDIRLSGEFEIAGETAVVEQVFTTAVQID